MECRRGRYDVSMFDISIYRKFDISTYGIFRYFDMSKFDLSEILYFDICEDSTRQISNIAHVLLCFSFFAFLFPVSRCRRSVCAANRSFFKDGVECVRGPRVDYGRPSWFLARIQGLYSYYYGVCDLPNSVGLDNM